MCVVSQPVYVVASSYDCSNQHYSYEWGVRLCCLCAWLQFAGTKKSDCVFATDTKTILGQIAKFMYLRLCVFMLCVFVFLGTLQYEIFLYYDYSMKMKDENNIYRSTNAPH